MVEQPARPTWGEGPPSPPRRASLADSGRRRLGARTMEPSSSENEIIVPSWMKAAERRLAEAEGTSAPAAVSPLGSPEGKGRRGFFEAEDEGSSFGDAGGPSEGDIEAEFEAVKRLIEEEAHRQPRRSEDGRTREVAEAARKRSKVGSAAAFLTDFDRAEPAAAKELYPNYSHEVRLRDDPPSETASVWSDRSSHAWAALVNTGSRTRATSLARQEHTLRRSQSSL